MINTAGGGLLIGVADDKSVVGIEHADIPQSGIVPFYGQVTSSPGTIYTETFYIKTRIVRP